MPDMVVVKKKAVQDFLRSFGAKTSIELEHDDLMAMLGVPMDDEYEDEEESAMPMDKMGKMGKHGGPKMMALKIMLGKES